MWLACGSKRPCRQVHWTNNCRAVSWTARCFAAPWSAGVGAWCVC
jgi:hypothetical protein